MEELMLSMENLKQQLICTFCNELVDNSYKFIVCSHIFCKKHLKSSRMKKCFLCHKGDIQNVITDQIVNQMVLEYRQLKTIFNSMKENVHLELGTKEQARANSEVNKLLSENKNLKKLLSSKSGTSNITSEIVPEKRVLRNKLIKDSKDNSPDVSVIKKIKKSEGKSPQDMKESTSMVSNYFIKPSYTRKTSKSPLPNSPHKHNQSHENSINSTPSKVSDVSEKCTTKNNKKKSKCAPTRTTSVASNELSLDISMSTCKGIMKRNKKGETCLHSACVQNKIEEVRILLEEGASPNTKDNAGWTPLHEAVAGGNLPLVQLLLNHGAFPQVPGLHYETPLHEAVRSQFSDIVQLLISAGANVHTKNDKGETPLSIASEDIKKILLSGEEQHAPSQIPDVSFNIHNDNIFCIFPLFLKKENKAKLQKLVKEHGNMKVIPEFSKNVSHILVETEDGYCYLTQDTLLAVVRGKPIVSSQWLEACNDSYIANVGEFYVTNLGGATECVHLSLMNNLTLMPGLFAGCHFYFVEFKSEYEISSHLTINKQFLCQLVTEGGGVVLRREPNPESIPENERIFPYHAAPGSPLELCAHYIIYRSRPKLAYNMKHLKSLPVAWLIECVQNFKLVDP